MIFSQLFVLWKELLLFSETVAAVEKQLLLRLVKV
jgi:hypothetical protein